MDEKIGLFEKSFLYLKEQSLKNDFEISPKDLADMTSEMRQQEMDAHIAIMGQNGLGKSMASFILQKHCGKISLDSMIFPFDSYEKIINILATREDENVYIDELNLFFDYMKWNSAEQHALMQTIETNRANKNVIFGCCRDIQRINLNYRNGKVHTLVWLLDRITGKNPYSYGVVLLGNPFFQTDDKFYLSTLPPIYDYPTMRELIEQLPSFIGYIKFDNVNKYVPKSIIDKYKAQKKRGMEYMLELQNNNLIAKQIRQQAQAKRLQKMLNDENE